MSEVKRINTTNKLPGDQTYIRNIKPGPPAWRCREGTPQPSDFGHIVQRSETGHFFSRFQPMRCTAPLFEPAGGEVYFAADVGEDTFAALLRLWGIDYPEGEWKKTAADYYAAFVFSSTTPASDGFWRQIRIVDRLVLEQAYGVRFGFQHLDQEMIHQTVPAGRLLWQFVQDERRSWELGDMRLAQLGFAAMIECRGAVRVWSRFWCSRK